MTDRSSPETETLIEKEAKRRCLADEYTLDYLACQDRRFAHDDRRPWWKAMYYNRIKLDIEDLKKAGFSVVPAGHAQATKGLIDPAVLMGVVQAEINDYVERNNRGDLTEFGEHGWSVLVNLQRDMEFALSKSSTDRCAECGHPRAAHSYNGACYGLCGKFVPPDSSPLGEGK
jgi:hypothetical protein